jgi:hypothetical protein
MILFRRHFGSLTFVASGEIELHTDLVVEFANLVTRLLHTSPRMICPPK